MWAFDFLGIFLSRLIVGYVYFNFGLNKFKENKLKSLIYFISSFMIATGFLTSLISLFWILANLVLIIKEKRIDLVKLLLIAYFIILISVGPSLISIDRIFDIRLTTKI